MISIDLRKIIKDSVFPVFCISCNKEGVWLCDKCKKRLTICNMKKKGKFYISNHFSIFNYKSGSLIEKIIYTLKYDFVEDIYFVIDDIIKSSFNKNNYLDIDYIIPVPLHPRRYASRGFNQADLIAESVAKNIEKQVLKEILIRKKYTKTQTKLSKKDRVKNIIGAFDIRDKEKILDKKILLIDDIYTTGSTMEECAKVLKKSGAREVMGFTVARG